jgi:hypothetical protein
VRFDDKLPDPCTPTLQRCLLGTAGSQQLVVMVVVGQGGALVGVGVASGDL